MIEPDRPGGRRAAGDPVDAAGDLRKRLAARGLDWIVPEWDAPPNVRALMTTRSRGIDDASGSMNLGRATGDDAARVERNRALLREVTGVESLWLSQTHGTDVAVVGEAPPLSEADAAISTRTGIAATVRIADCMPVLLASRDGRVVGAAHAGWRGLVAGVLESTVAKMRAASHAGGANANASDDIVAWMGAAIGPHSFEVGDDVRDAFLTRDACAIGAFVRHPERKDKWLADLYALARMRLASIGIPSVRGGEWCTVRNVDRFFSYRRDQSVERMAALVWIESEPVGN